MGDPITLASHSPGTPFSAWRPRSSNLTPAPGTRSLRTAVTRTSPGPARARTLAAICTATPESFLLNASASPMEACPDLDPERAYGVTDGGSAANRIGRPVEGGEEPISRRVDLSSLELPQLAPDDLVMARQ